MPRSSLQVFVLLLRLRRLEELLQILVPVREDLSVHDIHVVNTVCYSFLEVVDQKVSLLIWFLLRHGHLVEK